MAWRTTGPMCPDGQGDAANGCLPAVQERPRQGRRLWRRRQVPEHRRRRVRSTAVPGGIIPNPPKPDVLTGILAGVKSGALLKKSALAKGVGVKYTCTVDSAAKGALTITKKTATKLGIKTKKKQKSVTIASGKGQCSRPRWQPQAEARARVCEEGQAGEEEVPRHARRESDRAESDAGHDEAVRQGRLSSVGRLARARSARRAGRGSIRYRMTDTTCPSCDAPAPDRARACARCGYRFFEDGGPADRLPRPDRRALTLGSGRHGGGHRRDRGRGAADRRRRQR